MNQSWDNLKKNTNPTLMGDVGDISYLLLYLTYNLLIYYKTKVTVSYYPFYTLEQTWFVISFK